MFTLNEAEPINTGGTMSTNKRKQLRVTIPARFIEAFNSAKKNAENDAGIILSDAQFASRLLILDIARRVK